MKIGADTGFLIGLVEDSTADALILATFVFTECDLVLSRDEDFKLPAEQGIIVLEMLGGETGGSSHR